MNLELKTSLQALEIKSQILNSIDSIGGHGFLDGVWVHTPGVGQQICRPPSAAKIFPTGAYTRG